MAQGYRYVRCQSAVPGLATYGARSNITRWQRMAQGESSGEAQRPLEPQQAPRDVDHKALEGVWEPTPYARLVPRLFEHLRNPLGDGVELLHDVHERLPPVQALGLAKALEPYHLFFLEDPLAPEDSGYFRIMRQQTTTPIAMGELFVNQAEYMPLIEERLIDFIRVHISDIGGISVARKLAALCEFYGIRTAWHGPGDVSPVGHAANLHPRSGVSQLRHSGAACFQSGRARCVSRHAGNSRRRALVERSARLGRGARRRPGIPLSTA